jgi:hypothetical protein
MKTMNYFFVFFAFLSLGACKDTTATTSNTANTPKKDTLSPTQPFQVDLDNEVPDTSNFNENGFKFRLLEDTANYRYAIERLENTQWKTLDSFDRPRVLGMEDWNKDGYLDISMGQKWNINMALFNPTKNAFEKPFDIGEPNGAFLLDAKKQLYYSMLTNKFEDEHSQLFTIENYRQILRGYIEGYVGDEEYASRNKPRGVYVYKFKNNTLPEEKLYEEANVVLVEKFTLDQYHKINTSPYLFYKQYWEKNASKF